MIQNPDIHSNQQQHPVITEESEIHDFIIGIGGHHPHDEGNLLKRDYDS